MSSIVLTAAMFIAGASMSVTADVRDARTRNSAAAVSKATLSCGSGQNVVSYRFTGTPGSSVRYGRKNFTIPTSGSIELVADRKVKAYATDHGDFQLVASAEMVDGFGTVTVNVDSNQIALAAPSRYEGDETATAPVVLAFAR